MGCTTETHFIFYCSECRHNVMTSNSWCCIRTFQHFLTRQFCDCDKNPFQPCRRCDVFTEYIETHQETFDLFLENSYRFAKHRFSDPIRERHRRHQILLRFPSLYAVLQSVTPWRNCSLTSHSVGVLNEIKHWHTMTPVAIICDDNDTSWTHYLTNLIPDCLKRTRALAAQPLDILMNFYDRTVSMVKPFFTSGQWLFDKMRSTLRSVYSAILKPVNEAVTGAIYEVVRSLMLIGLVLMATFQIITTTIMYKVMGFLWPESKAYFDAHMTEVHKTAARTTSTNTDWSTSTDDSTSDDQPPTEPHGESIGFLPFAVTLTGIMFCMSAGSPALKAAAERMRVLSLMATGGVILNNLATYLWYVLPIGIKSCLIDKFGSREVKIQQQYEDWQLHAETLLLMSRSPQALSDVNFQKRLRSVSAQYSEFDLTVLPRSLVNKGTNLLFKLLHIGSIIFNMQNQTKTRIVPFSIHLAGSPGSGKTSTIRHIKEKFASTQSFAVPQGDEYWSGCQANVDTITWDEFLIGTTSDESVKTNAKLFLQLISSDPFQPPMASVDDPTVGIKGTTIAPRLVITMNNTLYNHVEGIDASAMARRRNFVINTRIASDAYMKPGSNCNVDLTKYTEQQKRDLTFIDYYVYPAEQSQSSAIVSSKPLKLPELLKFLFHHYQDHISSLQGLIDNTQIADQTFSFDSAWDQAMASVMELPRGESLSLGGVLDTSLRSALADSVETETHGETPLYKDVYLLVTSENTLTTVCENWNKKGNQFFSFPCVLSNNCSEPDLAHEMFLEKYSLAQIPKKAFRTIYITQNTKQTIRYHLVNKKVVLNQGFPVNSHGNTVSNGIYYAHYDFDSATQPFGTHDNFYLTKTAREVSHIIRDNVSHIREVFSSTEIVEGFDTIHQGSEVDTASYVSAMDDLTDVPLVGYDHREFNCQFMHRHSCATPNCSNTKEFMGPNCPSWTCPSCESETSDDEDEFFVDDLAEYHKYCQFKKQKSKERWANIRSVRNRINTTSDYSLMPTYALVTANDSPPENQKICPWWKVVISRTLSIMGFIVTMLCLKRLVWTVFGWDTASIDGPMFINSGGGSSKGSQGGEEKSRKSAIYRRWTKAFQRKTPPTEIHGPKTNPQARLILPGGSSVNVIPINDGWILCHGHWWYEHYFNNQVTVTVQQGKRAPFQYTLGPDNMVFMDSNDLIMINIIHPSWQKTKDITSKFLSDAEWDGLDGLMVGYTDLNDVTHSGQSTYRPDYCYSSHEREYKCGFALLGNFSSVRGNCGLPVYGIAGRYSGRLVGLIVSGSTEHRICGISVVTREMIHSATQNSFVVPCHPTFINSNFVSRNIVPKKEMVSIPCKTKLEPSNIAAHIPYKPQKQPAVLTVDDPRLPKGNKGPIINAVERLDDNRQVPLNPSIFNKVTRQQRSNFDKHLYEWENRELTMDEAVRGIPGLLSSIDLNTSPGYPWVLRRPGAHKSHWISINQDGTVTYRYGIDSVIRNAYNEIRSGIEPEDYRWIGYMKDELVSETKIEEGRTRIIYTGDFVYTIAFRMLYGGVMLRFNNTSQGTPLCIQQNQFSFDMNDIYLHLTSSGNSRFSGGDYKHFDQKMQRCFQEAAYDLFASYAPPTVPVTAHEIFKHVQMNSPMQIGDAMLRVQSTHFSGCLLTTLVNCFVNELYFAYIFYHLYPNRDFYEEIRLKVMGDDNIFSSSNQVTFNTQTMADNAYLVGQVYTSDVKNEPIVPYKAFTELTFCGAHPRMLSNGQYTGAMRKTTLEESILWTRNENATLLSETIQMVEYASQWDENYYLTYKKNVDSALSKAGWMLVASDEKHCDIQRKVAQRTTGSGEDYGKTYINSNDTITESPVLKTTVDAALGVTGAIVGTVALFVAKKIYNKIRRLTATPPVDEEVPEVPMDPSVMDKPTYVHMSPPPTEAMQSVVIGSTKPETSIVLDVESPAANDPIGQSVASQESLMSSMVLRHKVEWKNSHAPGEIIAQWTLPGELVRAGDNQSYQTQNFKFYQYWRGKIVVTVTLYAPFTAVGALCLSWVKMQHVKSTVSLMNVTTRPHVMIPAVTGTDVYSLEIPFDYFMDYFPLNKGHTTEETAMGRLVLSVYGRFNDLNVNSTQVSIFTSFKDNDFLLTRTLHLFTHGANVSRNVYNYDMHDISGTITTQNSVKQKNDAKADAVLPLDRPIVAGGSIPHFNKNLSYSNTDGPDMSNIMSTRRCHMEMEHLAYETDESEIATILRLPSTLTTHFISKSTPIGDLFTVPLTTAFTDNFGPSARFHRLRTLVSSGDTQVQNHAIEVPFQTAIFGQFDYWKADFVFRFLAIKSSMHCFTLRVTYMPNVYSVTGEEKECYCNAYLKFDGQSNVFDVRVPWKSPYPFLHTFDNTGCLSANSSVEDWTAALRDQCLGLLVVELVSPLIAPSIVPEKIGLAVQVWFEDAEVSKPKASDCFSFVSPQSMVNQMVNPSSSLYVHYNTQGDTDKPDDVFKKATKVCQQLYVTSTGGHTLDSNDRATVINSPPPKQAQTVSDLTPVERAVRDSRRPPQALKYYVKLKTSIMIQTDMDVVLNFLRQAHTDGPGIVPSVETCKTHPYLISVVSRSGVALRKSYIKDKVAFWGGKVMTATEYSVSLEANGECDPDCEDPNYIRIFTDEESGKILVYRCLLCDKKMSNDNEYYQHLSSNRHQTKLELDGYMRSRREQVEPKPPPLAPSQQHPIPARPVSPKPESPTPPTILPQQHLTPVRPVSPELDLPAPLRQPIAPARTVSPNTVARDDQNSPQAIASVRSNSPEIPPFDIETIPEEERSERVRSPSPGLTVTPSSLADLAHPLPQKNPVYTFTGQLLTLAPLSNSSIKTHLRILLTQELWEHSFEITSDQPRLINFHINLRPIPPLSYHTLRNALSSTLQSSGLWYYSLRLPFDEIHSDTPAVTEPGHNLHQETALSMGEPSKVEPVEPYGTYPHRPFVAPVTSLLELGRRYTLLSQDDTTAIKGFHSTLTWRTYKTLDCSAAGSVAKNPAGYYCRKGTTVKIFHLGCYGVLPHFYRCMGGSLSFRFRIVHHQRPVHPSIVTHLSSIGELDASKAEKIALIDTVVTNYMDSVSSSQARVRMVYSTGDPSATAPRANFLMGNAAVGGCSTNFGAPYEIFSPTNDPLVEECFVTVPLTYVGRRFPLYLDQRKTLGSLSVIAFSESAAIVASVAGADDFTYSSFVTPDQCCINTFTYQTVHSTTKTDRLPFTSGGINLNYQ
ncbi:hypothetical protein [Beihai picorna-like virus 67]|uniref:hypothetical protein n=1 Tax=Beihai picorna-like virus 67 TaxID=1922613 RepID=UPI000909EE64|nr:hypothetical protein [Beihai picorna-like virus 67]APG78950.1 hypothetical protein [Beihai picorna-like virus 67]